ncbi:EF-hand domain-containing protein [Sphingomonas cavernae]|uniref:EF-hand domain-containing protein n=1 Tax=Sphingomonas cavernae TaxID=2320861 RepID=A0A418W605_9SPHN|nr:EF-hand domain-containing protein [Sphingomonas cavernae]RJF85470.1 EF-hand domain-containing protein [Sphingomonas cavernae]
MIRTVIFASAIALSAPVIAQETQTPPAAPSETTATQAPSEAAPAAPAQEAAPAAQAQPAGASQVAQVVDADFPAYDKDSNGELSQTEFSAWMLKLRQAGGDATPETELTAWAGAAFAQADADKNKTVSKGELTRFLAG